MVSKWQLWMPFYIDKFKASPAVRAMHPAARAGYLYLLTCQWQSDDCTISADPLDLAEMSELGDELWAQHGPRILRKFDQADDGRLRNRECFSEWQEAKRIFEARRHAAEKTTRIRSPHKKDTVTVHEDDGDRPKNERSADTRTGTRTGTYTGTGTGTEENPAALHTPPALDHVDVARRVGEECRITSTGVIREIQEQAKLELADGRTADDIAAEIAGSIQAYRTEKPKLQITWGLEKFIGEGHWRDPTGWPRKETLRDVYKDFREADV